MRITSLAQLVEGLKSQFIYSSKLLLHIKSLRSSKRFRNRIINLSRVTTNLVENCRWLLQLVTAQVYQTRSSMPMQCVLPPSNCEPPVSVASSLLRALAASMAASRLASCLLVALPPPPRVLLLLLPLLRRQLNSSRASSFLITLQQKIRLI